MEQDIPDGFGGADTIETPPDTVPSPASRPRGGDRRLDPETRRRIGRSLRVLYAGILVQPMPERFEVLVAAFAARSDKEPAR